MGADHSVYYKTHILFCKRTLWLSKHTKFSMISVSHLKLNFNILCQLIQPISNKISITNCPFNNSISKLHQLFNPQ